MSAGGGMARTPTQCDRVLAVLDDGLWHSIHEIHDRAGSMRLNSRISELRRKRGLVIQQRQQRDPRTGERNYGYQLLGEQVPTPPRADAGVTSPASACPSGCSSAVEHGPTKADAEVRSLPPASSDDSAAEPPDVAASPASAEPAGVGADGDEAVGQLAFEVAA